MNKNFFILLLIRLDTNLVIGQTIPCADSAQLNTKLNTIRDVDQNSRKEFIKILAENNLEITKALAVQMKKTDKENQQFVAGLLDNCGWRKDSPQKTIRPFFW